MSNVLVRGLPRRVQERIQRYAHSQDLSVNQMLVRWIISMADHVENQEEKEEREKEAFRRIREIREEIRRKYGKQEDSAKLLKEIREERMKRYDEWTK